MTSPRLGLTQSHTQRVAIGFSCVTRSRAKVADLTTKDFNIHRQCQNSLNSLTDSMSLQHFKVMADFEGLRVVAIIATSTLVCFSRNISRNISKEMSSIGSSHLLARSLWLLCSSRSLVALLMAPKKNPRLPFVSGQGKS